MPVLRITGFVLVAGLVVWIGLWFTRAPHPAPRLLDDSHAFEGNVQLPADQIQQALTNARVRMDKRYAESEQVSTLAILGDWLAFLLTAVITLLAGFEGRITALTAPTSENLAEILRSAGRHFSRTVGLIAAGAAICTAASAKAKDLGDNLYNDAVAIQAAAMSARKDIARAPDATSAQDALDQLKQAVSKY